MPPRYAPDHAFPAYAFLPGRTPHPTRDPDGHSYGRTDEPAPYAPAQAWRANGPYLAGVDLYNHGYPWEAHEAWEAIWNAARDAGDDEQTAFLQGLIQCAAACVKARLDEPASVVRLADRALERLASVSDHYMGVDVAAFVAAFAAFAADPTGAPPELLLQLE